ncbi:MAG: hypothetical protein AUJ49_04925 [Desulfovibrionaceae bacterium CG1_02_65_16]|nr:MAG: hypothetical protein AUJ49_04925 [Desulfovibrionaceae bacterium CG1_02_65_16]
MMLPTFKRWVAELALFYSNPTWPTEENVKAAFADARHIEEAALDAIGGFIRTEYEYWPKSLSRAMRRGYAKWQADQAEARKTEERRNEATTWRPPTQEESARNESRCRDILHALRTGKRPAWANQRQYDGSADTSFRRA